VTRLAPPPGKEQPVEKLPTPLNFLLETPLYKEYMVGPGNENWLSMLGVITGPLDAYCIYCKDRSLFSRDYETLQQTLSLGQYKTFSINLHCARSSSHIYHFEVRLANSAIQKIGQYPSVADISIPQLVRYRALLGNERYAEFTKAVGLAAHGVGIGSFVYLRRVLESLLEDAHEEARSSAGWDEDAYARSRVVEKIGLLRNYLPAFLVKNRAVYGILSKGIHELSEDECKRYFAPLKSAIELILNEHLIAMEHRKNLEEAEKGLAAIHKELTEG
jgi:hypothetical protein